MNDEFLSSLISSVGDLLRGDFKRSSNVGLTVLRRLDCILEDGRSTSFPKFDTLLTACLEAQLSRANRVRGSLKITSNTNCIFSGN